MTEPVSISNAIAKKTFNSNAHLPIHEFESDVNLTDLDLFTNGQPFDQFKKIFGSDIGFSDHTIGSEASIIAVAKGAKIIEKHFTLDRNMAGPDHSSSLDFNQFKSLVLSIRKVEKFFSSQKKIVTKSEKKNIRHVRKSIVAKEKILFCFPIKEGPSIRT